MPIKTSQAPTIYDLRQQESKPVQPFNVKMGDDKIQHGKSCSTGGQGPVELDAVNDAAVRHSKQASQAALVSIANLSEILPEGEDTASDLAQLIDRRTGSLMGGCWASQRKSVADEGSQEISLDFLMETKKNNFFIK